MMNTLTLDAAPGARVAAKPVASADDKLMLRTAAELTRDLNVPNQSIYWIDLIGSAGLGYAALAGAIGFGGWLAVAAALVSVLALYRAGQYDS